MDKPEAQYYGPWFDFMRVKDYINEKYNINMDDYAGK